MYNVNLMYNKSIDKFVLSYPYKDYGIQHFKFDGNVFLSCYNEDKKNVSILMKNFYPKMNQSVESILKDFVINPTVLKRCYNHKGKFSISLKEKVQIKKPRGRSVPKFKQDCFQIDQEEIKRCEFNKSVAVKKAKSSQDLVYFNMFLEAEIDLQIAKGLKSKYYKPTKKFEDNCFKSFIYNLNCN